MKGLKSFLVFVFALTIVNTCYAESKYQRSGSHWKVTILNNMKNSSLMAHCKSKDDDLGVHYIKVGGQYDWEFKENLLQSTLFWCYFRSQRGHASFEVFWPEKGTWLSERCNFSNCIWTAEDNGFYLRNIPKQQDEFLQWWKFGP